MNKKSNEFASYIFESGNARDIKKDDTLVVIMFSGYFIIEFTRQKLTNKYVLTFLNQSVLN